MSYKRDVRGYGLISIILVVLGIFTVALGFLSIAQMRLHALQEENIIETLHRSRVSAIGYFQEFGSWPNLELLRERTQIDSYVLDVQVLYSPAFHIRVRLPSAEKALSAQGQIHGSKAYGAWLHIGMPSEEKLSTLRGDRLVLRWLDSHGDYSDMGADISMQEHNIQDIKHLDAVTIESERVTAKTGYSGESTVTTSYSDRLNVDSISIEFLESEHVAVENLFASTGAVREMKLNTELRVRDWRQNQLQTSKLRAAEGAGNDIVTNTSLVNRLLTRSMSSQALGADIAEIEVVNMSTGYFSDLSAEIWNSETVHSVEGVARRAIAQEASVQSVNVSQGLYVSHGIGDSINASVQSATALYQQLEHCWYTDKWCRPPEIPNVSHITCSGCEQTAAEGLFQGRLDFQVGYCLHGCAIQIEANWASRAHCTPDNIDIGMHGHASCSFERYLSAGESLWDRAVVRVASGKESQTQRSIEANIRWETPITCPQTNYVFPIQGSNPPANGGIALPETQAGMQASHSNVGGIGCNTDFRISHWSCSVTGFCSAQGAWQDVSGHCICDYGD